ncbi:DnaJ domain-containing protein [bacterium]|nr:DnaJ domain-containing protein [bacterium]
MSVATTVDHGLLGLLADKVGSRSTGTLTVVRKNHKRLFCLDRGELTYALSNVIEEQYQVTLSRNGVLTGGAIAQIARLAAEREQKLHALLLEQEVPGRAVLEQAMADHVLWLLEDTLTWDSCDATFAKGRPQLDGEPTARIHGPAFVMDYVQRTKRSANSLRRRIGPPDMRPALVRKRRMLFDDASNDETVDYILEAATGEHQIDALAESTDASKDHLLRTIYGLRLLGVIENQIVEADTQADNRPSYAECVAKFDAAVDADHYGVLGLNAGSERKEVRDAYYYLAKRFHPDRLRTSELSEISDRIEEYFSRVTEAYNTLYDPELRAAYDKHREEKAAKPEVDPTTAPSYIARQNFARGKLLLDKGRYQDAIQFLENAVEQDNSVAIYHLELGRVLIRNPRRRKDAEEFLLTALDRDPTLSDAYLALGQLCRKVGRTDEAIARFREVLRWDPHNFEAKSELADMGAKESSEGGLRSWFKK